MHFAHSIVGWSVSHHFKCVKIPSHPWDFCTIHIIEWCDSFARYVS